ncbi:MULTISPECIES: TetR/AcrR family transcriptional regulator [unclassified Nocardiopsis]|uniref:TetR/AcrR family transcriptional regulator n=1 Tax=unclassified Nocardiopsis TaxID=2649073 RepID=UPI0013578A23|nr:MULTISPECIES: TetR family transcriptional regulator [unclassified Nocardiopsis]
MTAVQGRGGKRRATILEATTKLLLDQGMPAVTHRHVADAAQVPLGAIRYYFSTREELLLSAVDHLEKARSAAAAEAMSRASGALTVREVAELFVLAFYGPDLDDVSLKGYVGVVMDCSRESERLSLRMREHRRVMDTELRGLLDACGFPRVSVALATAVVDGSLLNAATLRLDDHAGIAVEELAQLLALT